MMMKNKPRVKVTIAPTLRLLSELSGEPEAWEIRAASAMECLQIMLKRYPLMKKWAYKGEELLPIIWFFVNDPEWRNKLTPDEFEKPLKEGDEVTIVFGKS
jgi:hypothetical protein